MQTIADYTIEEHKHIVSTWAAATAASSVKYKRFKVKVGKKVLENLDIREVIKEIPKLKSSEAFDAWHDKQCTQLVKLAITLYTVTQTGNWVSRKILEPACLHL